MSSKVVSFFLLWIPWIILLFDLVSRLGSTSTHEKREERGHNSVLLQALQKSKYSSAKGRLNLFALSSKNYSCTNGLLRSEDILIPKCQRHINREIPKIFHQTSRTRCLTPSFYNFSSSWRQALSRDYCFIFHDQIALERLLKKDWIELKLLNQVISCVKQATATVAADLWRYLVLWEYGGIYADIDSAPNNFNTTMLDGHQAFFVVDKNNMMSEYFMAVSPKHPILYYTLNHALQNVLAAKDTGLTFPGRTTGPHALLAGFRSFLKDVGRDVGIAADKPIRAGSYKGRNNWTVTVVGKSDRESEYVYRQRVGDTEKLEEYKKMDLKFYLNDLAPTNYSCLKLIFQGHFM